MVPIVRRILSLWRPHRWLAGALALSLLLRTAFTVVLAVSIKVIIDRITAGDSGRSSLGIVALLIAGYLVSAGASIVAGYLEARAGARVLADVRSAVFDHLQRLSVGFHSHARAGDVLARFSTDTAELSIGAVRKPRQALQSLLAILFFLPVMVLLEWRLAILTAVLMPLAVVIANRLTPPAGPALDTEKALLAEMLEEVNENLQAQPVIRAFGLQQRAASRFRAQLDDLKAGSTRANFQVQLLAAISQSVVAFVQLGIVGLGAILALNGDLGAGDFAAFVALLAEFSWETTVIAGDVIPEMAKTGSGIRRIDALLGEGPLVAERHEGVEPPPIARSIQFEDVGFSYRGSSDRQLDAFSLELPAGKRVALVGPSGSGKSTLLNMLLKFYDPDEGQVLVDSVNLASVDTTAYRQQVGVVFQDTFLFNASLRENIRVARADATEAEVESAAGQAGLAPVIERLPDGLDTEIGPGGRRLSGGQRQRIGIARALLRSPALILLDEVTSALDPVTEAAVNETIAHMAEDRTVVVVTHRLRTAGDADLIAVLQDGRLVEQGTFDELRGAGGVFAAMWEKQSGFNISGDGRGGEISPSRLRAVPLFQDLDTESLSGLADTFVADHFVAGEDIFQQGDPADRFHVIARGVTEVIRTNGAGHDVIAHLEDGDFFGEMAFLDDAPRNATVRAVTPTLTLSLDRNQFERLLDSSPEAAEIVRRYAADRAAAGGT